MVRRISNSKATAPTGVAWLVLLGLGASSAAAQQGGQQGGQSPLVADYPVFQRVEPPRAYREAVTAGTRSESGRPGPGYWQQRVDYRIEVRLDPRRERLEGSETIRYVNNAPRPLNGLIVRLYPNVFAPGVERNRPVQVTGGMRLERVAVAGSELQRLAVAAVRGAAEPPVGYTVEGTIASLYLPEPIPPGGSLELVLAWEAVVPGEWAFRTAHIDGQLFQVAQWYPQVATVDDVYGYDDDPYLGDGEFYLEYGDFEVAITVPEGWLVGATGELQNPEEVLPEEARQRLAAALASDSTVRVVGASDLEITNVPGAFRIWRYRAEQVRDFAFAASPRYVWDAVGAEVGGERGRALVHALYDPALEHWREAAGYAKHALEYLSRQLTPYPYAHATAAFGPVGGMEYPMLVFIGASAPGEPLYDVLAHELSHQWFPMVVGSREAAYAWMDEGFSTFAASLASTERFEHQLARLQAVTAYRQAAALELEAPLMQHTDHVPNDFGRGIAAYEKPAALLHALRRGLGEAAFDRTLRAYTEAWAFKHPYPWDFFSFVEWETGRDLDWLWRPWFYETATLDQALEEVTSVAEGMRVTVANLGEAVMPVELGLEFEDGTTGRVTWPVDVWAATRRVTRTVPTTKPVARVVIDPEQFFLDLDRRNNVWPEQRLDP